MVPGARSLSSAGFLERHWKMDRGTEGQKDRGTEGQRNRGTEGQRDRGTEVDRETFKHVVYTQTAVKHVRTEPVGSAGSQMWD